MQRLVFKSPLTNKFKGISACFHCFTFTTQSIVKFYTGVNYKRHFCYISACYDNVISLFSAAIINFCFLVHYMTTYGTYTTKQIPNLKLNWSLVSPSEQKFHAWVIYFNTSDKFNFFTNTVHPTFSSSVFLFSNFPVIFFFSVC